MVAIILGLILVLLGLGLILLGIAIFSGKLLKNPLITFLLGIFAGRASKN